MFEVGIILLLVVAGGWFIWGRMQTAQETSVRASAKAQLEELGIQYSTAEEFELMFGVDHTAYSGPAIIAVDAKPLSRNSLELISLFPETKYLALSVSGVDDEGVRQLSSMTNLEYLSLAHSSVTDDSLVVVSRFSKLKELDLTYTGIKGRGLSHLVALPTLERVHLGSNELTDDCVSALLSIKALKQVSLTHTFVSSRLEELRVAGISVENGSGLIFVADDPWLSPYKSDGYSLIRSQQGLSIDSVHAAWETIRKLALSADSQIEMLVPPDGIVTCLRVRGAKLNAEHFQALAKMKNLQCLDLAVSRFPAEFLSQLDSLTELRRIDLSRTAAGLVLRTDAKWLSRIESLHLRDAKLTGEELKGISKRVPALRILDLSGNPLSSVAVSPLAECVTLEELTLARTEVSAEALRALAKLPALRRLDLRGTGLREADVSFLKKSRPSLKVLVDSSPPSEQRPQQGGLRPRKLSWLLNSGPYWRLKLAIGV